MLTQRGHLQDEVACKAVEHGKAVEGNHSVHSITIDLCSRVKGEEPSNVYFDCVGKLQRQRCCLVPSLHGLVARRVDD